MKIPKQFTKMTLNEQEVWLVKKLRETHEIEDEIRRMLANVRKGYKYEPSTEVDRPDLLILKA